MTVFNALGAHLQGRATYAPRWPDQRLELLDKRDLKEQNKVIGEILIMLEPAIVIMSWDTNFAGRSTNLEQSLIERLDVA